MNPGAVVASSFEILRTIGSGGMGDVYQARRLRDGAIIALKILRLELLRDPEAVTRFRREGRAAAALRSPHAARIFDVGETEQGQPFIVMEYLEGCDLMHEIDTRGALPVVEALSFVAQACHAMIEAHELGIVHRDLKPPNIFLATEGHRRVAKVLDFGISKVQSINDARLTSTQMSFGSPLYMSPEQIRSTKLVDQRSDVWSLGVILYEALTGEPPFMGETPGALAVVISVEPHLPASHKNPQIPLGLDDVIAGALQKDPKKRYASVRELLRALEDFLPQTDLGLSATVREPPALPEPPTAPAPSHAMAPSAPRAFTTAAPAVTSPPVPQQQPAQAEQPPPERRGEDPGHGAERHPRARLARPRARARPWPRQDRPHPRGDLHPPRRRRLRLRHLALRQALRRREDPAHRQRRRSRTDLDARDPGVGRCERDDRHHRVEQRARAERDDRAGRRVRQRLTQAEGEADGAADGQEATAACRALSVERRRLPRPQGLGAVPVHRRTIA